MVCVVESNFYTTVIVTSLLPIVICVVVALVMLAEKERRKYKEQRKDEERRSSIIREVQETMWALSAAAILLVLYVTLPTTTKDILRVFSCERFDTGELLLRADYSVNCKTSESHAMRVFAAFMVAVWPFGVPLLFFVLLFRNRTAVQNEEKSDDNEWERDEDDDIHWFRFLWDVRNTSSHLIRLPYFKSTLTRLISYAYFASLFVSLPSSSSFPGRADFSANRNHRDQDP